MSRNQKTNTARSGRAAFPNLAAWRKAHKLNQRDAANVLGVSQTKYSRFERRLQLAKGKEAKRIVFTTGVPLEVIVGAA